MILEGKSLGGLIGRRGETLDAIQQLTSYAVNRSGGGPGAGPAGRRGLPGEAGAEPPAPGPEGGGQGRPSFRRSVTLEPMNAYERHVIHAALQERAGGDHLLHRRGAQPPGGGGLRPGEEIVTPERGPAPGPVLFLSPSGGRFGNVIEYRLSKAMRGKSTSDFRRQRGGRRPGAAARKCAAGPRRYRARVRSARAKSGGTAGQFTRPEPKTGSGCFCFP